jgi:hypothetical protein
MRGEPVTVENIKKKVTETFNNFTESNKMDGEFHYQHVRSQAGKASDAVVDVLGRLFRFIGGVLGFFFLMLGLILITIILCTWYDPTILQFGHDTWNMQWADVNGLIFDSRSQGNMFFAGAMTVGIIPIIGLILLGAKLLFRWDIKGKPVVPALIALWLIGFGLLIVTGISLGKEFSQRGEYVEIGKRMSSEVPLTIHIANGESGHNVRSRNHWVGNFPEEYLEVDGEHIIGHYPRIDISVNDESLECIVKVHKRARGFTIGSGDQRAENIEYPFSFNDQNELTLSPVFTAPLKDRFRAQECEIEILIPVGQIIYISEEVQNFLDNVEKTTYYSRSELVGKEWLMTPEGIVLAGSKPQIEIPEEEI